ncbi:acetate kinase [Stomatohabitans albus]|uniref:acetate/propionate family kinase n=1 Tax=Stomatohabitans albus TaxID=3110766 RepID=UPI00300D1562
MNILVVNAGSSSLKYEVFTVEDNVYTSVAEGLVERIGESVGAITMKLNGNKDKQERTFADHKEALAAVLDHLGEHGLVDDLAVVGHRMVHGGEEYTKPTQVTEEILKDLDKLSPLAPLHNPPCITGVRAAMELRGDVPHVIVFDTAYHATLAEDAYRYAVPKEWYTNHGVRRYGFHGTSHKYVANTAVRELGLDPNNHKVITAHLGNGASITAIKDGKSIETSMGLTPLEGLVMGTRSGNIDPAIPFYIMRQTGMSAQEAEDALNRQSGLKGVCGDNDARAVEERADSGDADAKLALDLFAHRVRGYIGEYSAHLGGLDAIVFTGGIGENSATMRAAILEPLAHMGIEIDPARNDVREFNEAGTRVISTGAVKVIVVLTQEQEQIARESVELLGL